MAGALGFNWSEQQRLFLSLQEEDARGAGGLIPKSQGKRLWAAKPGYGISFLVAIGFRGSGMTPHQAARLRCILTPEGRELGISEWPAAGITGPFERHLTELLTDPTSAAKVRVVVFGHARKSVEIWGKGAHRPVRYMPPDELPFPLSDIFRQGIGEAVAVSTRRRTSQMTVIEGEALLEIAQRVRWRASDGALFVHETEPDRGDVAQAERAREATE